MYLKVFRDATAGPVNHIKSHRRTYRTPVTGFRFDVVTYVEFSVPHLSMHRMVGQSCNSDIYSWVNYIVVIWLQSYKPRSTFYLQVLPTIATPAIPRRSINKNSYTYNRNYLTVRNNTNSNIVPIEGYAIKIIRIIRKYLSCVSVKTVFTFAALTWSQSLDTNALVFLAYSKLVFPAWKLHIKRTHYIIQNRITPFHGDRLIYFLYAESSVRLSIYYPYTMN